VEPVDGSGDFKPHRNDVGTDERREQGREGPAVCCGEGGEGGALEAQGRVLSGQAGRVAALLEVPDRVQAGRELRDEQRNQGQGGDQPYLGLNQGSHLCQWPHVSGSGHAKSRRAPEAG